MEILHQQFLPVHATHWLYEALGKAFLPSVRIGIVLGMTPVLSGMPVPIRIRALLVVVLSLLISYLQPGIPAIDTYATSGFLQGVLHEAALGMILA